MACAQTKAGLRPPLPFRKVNQIGQPGYQSGMQRHHLLPWQLLSSKSLSRMIVSLGRKRVGFDDFRRNGLLLPCNEEVSLRVGLPLHRGPHRQYNAVVAERVGRIESGYMASRLATPKVAVHDALMRLDLLQSALRRRLLASAGRRLYLSLKDPFRAGLDFSELDAMAETLWAATGREIDR